MTVCGLFLLIPSHLPGIAMSDEREPSIHPFETRLAASWPPGDWKDLTVLVAVSGGGDSVALLRGLAALKPSGEGRLIAAHVNHELRGADSDADQAFVQELCRQLRLACEVSTAKVDPTAGSRGQGIEAAARACAVRRPGRDGRARGGALCRYRAHGRRSGRDNPPSYSSRHGPPRPGRNVAVAATRSGDAPAAAAGHGPRGSDRIPP